MIKSLFIIVTMLVFLIVFILSIASGVANCEDFEDGGRMSLVPMPERCLAE